MEGWRVPAFIMPVAANAAGIDCQRLFCCWLGPSRVRNPNARQGEDKAGTARCGRKHHDSINLGSPDRNTFRSQFRCPGWRGRWSRCPESDGHFQLEIVRGISTQPSGKDSNKLIPIDRSKPLLLLAIESKRQVIYYRREWNNVNLNHRVFSNSFSGAGVISYDGCFFWFRYAFACFRLSSPTTPSFDFNTRICDYFPYRKVPLAPHTRSAHSHPELRHRDRSGQPAPKRSEGRTASV